MELINYFKALSDITRLRLLNLLLHQELNVNEIVSALDMGQSRISRHLKILTDSGLLTSRRDGLWAFYRAVKDGEGSDFIKTIDHFIQGDDSLKEDLHHLERILEERSKEKARYFDSIASNWDVIKGDIIGDVNIKDEILSRLNGCDIAADLGCGTGDLLPYLKTKAKRVIGIDRSPKMLEEARRRLSNNGSSIDLRIGEIEHLPMRDGEADTAIINMVLHHLQSPNNSLAEAGRILKKNSRLIIVDLDKHRNEEMRNRFGHRWLGFTKKEMEGWLKSAGFKTDEFKQFNIKKDLRINLFLSIKQ